MNKGCQSVLARNGAELFSGEWNPATLFQTLSAGDDSFWRGKRVLDIGANTCGLAVEIARGGAIVTALEPDPYNNAYDRSKEVIESICEEEGLSLTVERKGFFDAHNFKGFDVVLCLGLLYHFRYPQLMLDYLSTLGMEWLFLSTQVHPGNALAIFNRQDVDIAFPSGFFENSDVLSGWHPTRPMIERMLMWAGFSEVVSLTDKPYVFPAKQNGLTNSAYYRCRRVGTVDPMAAMAKYYPR